VGDAEIPDANWPFTIHHFVVTVTPLLGGNMDYMKEENFDAQQASLCGVHQCG
jgi:diacylglycerol kinase family enzyme